MLFVATVAPSACASAGQRSPRTCMAAAAPLEPLPFARVRTLLLEGAEMRWQWRDGRAHAAQRGARTPLGVATARLVRGRSVDGRAAAEEHVIVRAARATRPHTHPSSALRAQPVEAPSAAATAPSRLRPQRPRRRARYYAMIYAWLGNVVPHALDRAPR